MPRRNQPYPLQKSCMLSIARNFDYICYRASSKQHMSTMIDNDSYLQVESPFKHLPGSLCEGVLETLKELLYVRRHHLVALMQPSLTMFSLSSVGNQHMAAHLLQERCSRLRHLDLSYLRTVSPPVLIRLIPTLSHVTVLNLSMTQAMDQVLGLIGHHCPELRELDVSNTPITENGLTRLCYDAQQDRPLCQHLVKLSLTGCLISAKPVCFLLQYIPTIRDIDYDDIFQVFGVMKQWGLTEDNLQSCNKYQLRILNSTNEFVDPANVDIAIALCPYATNFTLSNAFVENEVLYKVMQLEYLTHLRLTNCEALTLNFQEGVLPVLTVKGHQLISLLLANFTSVDVAAIGECCPGLQNLALSGITVYEDITYPREQYFNNLRNLEVWSSVTSDTCNATILRQLLLYAPYITNLLVKATDALSDKLLFEIWRENEMCHLSRLTIDSCQNVTACVMHHLLDVRNQLSLLRVWSCLFITKHDQNQLKQRIKDENCDVYLEWYSWNG